MLDLSTSQLTPAAPTHVCASRPASEPALQMVWTRARGSAGKPQFVCTWTR